MTYWKFLRAGGVSPFAGHVWEPGQWVTATGADACQAGVHACRAADLPYWLNVELWRFELAEPVSLAEHKIVSARARAVARVPEWDAEAAAELALACAARTAGHAAGELTDGHLDDEARRLAEVTSAAPPAVWIKVAQDCAEAANARGARQAIKLCEYVLDAVDALQRYPVASTAYIAARAANQRSSAEEADPYRAERAWQADWLVRRLGLDAPY